MKYIVGRKYRIKTESTWKSQTMTARFGECLLYLIGFSSPHSPHAPGSHCWRAATPILCATCDHLTRVITHRCILLVEYDALLFTLFTPWHRFSAVVRPGWRQGSRGCCISLPPTISCISFSLCCVGIYKVYLRFCDLCFGTLFSSVLLLRVLFAVTAESKCW